MAFNRAATLVGALLLIGLLSPGSEAEDSKSKETPIAPGVQRERVNLVLIDVVVTDRKGHRIDDLRPDEFSLRVDGKPHAIESVELLWSAGALASEASPGAGKKQATSGSLPGQQSNRRFIFLLDGLNCEHGLA